MRDFCCGSCSQAPTVRAVYHLLRLPGLHTIIRIYAPVFFLAPIRRLNHTHSFFTTSTIHNPGAGECADEQPQRDVVNDQRHPGGHDDGWEDMQLGGSLHKENEVGVMGGS